MKELANKPQTFAECIAAFRGRGISDDFTDRTCAARKLTWDAAVLKAVEQTHHISPEEITSHLSHASFPFNTFWIEGPSFLPSSSHTRIAEPYPDDFPTERFLANPFKVGALVKARPEENRFEFIFLKEEGLWDYSMRKTFISRMQDRGASEELILTEVSKVLEMGKQIFFQDGTMPCPWTSALPVSVDQNGINLNDDELLVKLGFIQDQFSDFSSRECAEINYVPAEDYISELYGVADFLARFFVLLGSPNFSNNLDEAVQEQNKRQKELGDVTTINRKRIKDGKKPLMVSPSHILIDISDLDQVILDSGKEKQIRQLLGWTDVRRSKEMTSKYGKKFFRKAHERRIAAAVDRRGAATTRDVTASSVHSRAEVP